MEDLLNEYLSLYLNNGSHDELVLKIADYYKKLNDCNYKYAIRELEILIYLKRKYKNLSFFCLDDNYFSEEFKYMSINKDTLAEGAIFHELTHLLHWNGGRKIVIPDFNYNVSGLMKKKTISNYIDYTNYLKKRIDFLSSKIEYLFNKKIINEYGSYSEYNKYLFDLFLKDNYLVVKFDNDIYTHIVKFTDFEDYKECYNKKVKDKLKNILIYRYFDNEGLISDFMDGLLVGKIGSHKILDNNGNVIYSLRNHNEHYYSIKENQDEVLADYGALIKSRSKYIDDLINIVGLDLIDYINDCYEKIINYDSKILIKK